MDKCRILIVDDDPRLSRLVRVMLDKTGIFNTAVENHPHHALASARRFKPDLVLMDVDMPGKDGGCVAREMKSDPLLKDIAIVFLTSLVSTHEAGVRDLAGEKVYFLSKPTVPLVLLKAIKETLAANHLSATTP